MLKEVPLQEAHIYSDQRSHECMNDQGKGVNELLVERNICVQEKPHYEKYEHDGCQDHNIKILFDEEHILKKNIEQIERSTLFVQLEVDERNIQNQLYGDMYSLDDFYTSESMETDTVVVDMEGGLLNELQLL